MALTRRGMRRGVQSIFNLAMTVAIAYTFGAFVEWDANPVNWWWAMRMFIAFSTIIAGGVAAAYPFIPETNMEGQRA